MKQEYSDMKCNGVFSSVKELFAVLNSSEADYLVMRNHENLLTSSFFVDGHPDIDMLCEDSDAIARLLGASPTRHDQSGHIGDGTHYYVFVDGRKVSIDLRHLGDGYFCLKWQQDALKRKKYNGHFFVMHDEDYFYTLVYHAILQKPSLSAEYQQRLISMAETIGVELTDTSARGLINILHVFMRAKGYTFTYPLDATVPLHTSLIDRSMLECDFLPMLRHFLFDVKVKTIDAMVCLKHAIRL